MKYAWLRAPSRGRRRTAAARRRTTPTRRRRLVEQHEGRRDARCGDGAVRLRLVLPLHVEAVDVHDARELADAIEEGREVVIGALELQRDRPLGVQLLGDRRRRLE